jgi:predicted nucleic-acid-binding Zn-ribbon protein
MCQRRALSQSDRFVSSWPALLTCTSASPDDIINPEKYIASIGDQNMVCPKCGGEMLSGTLAHAFWVRDGTTMMWESMKQSNWFIPGLECEKCGYLELYSPNR